ncbi:hypothetical protein ANN_00689 [Periplaneta americana]|uniref:Kinesin motor domain-containing protein n=1 Tax=Periplaneta americana TaxID=6978 RepID=A0ABQ8TRG6_PERAM|nr:hypothetical protein ANN_00689 [Periplaneta americana]
MYGYSSLQTGSGKTYTMGTGFDVEVQPEQVGIIPRAIHHLFQGIKERGDQAREAGQPAPEFKIVAQFMELYNEEVIDLFDPSREQYATRQHAMWFQGKSGIKIHEDASGGIYVVGVTMKPVMSAEDALQCLRMGALSRTTASTQMNSQSSRSHAIFTLHIKQQRMVKVENMDDGDSVVATDPSNEFETLTAKFHFVDLAGSERLKRTGATGERAKEGISINCGLLALGNVISALGDKSRKALHVPYRDSKLTRLLQDSLGGNSQTVMIACVSPSDRDFMETLNTLKYANRARNIKNRVTINQDKSSRTIVLLRQEIQQLQLELLEYKQGKRMVSEDGVETVNDMFHENTMLQTENNNLRTRVKAMQETIDALSSKNTQLLAEKAMGGWISTGSECDVTEMIQGYLKEIEELRAKLLESEAICQQLRKQSSRSPPRGALSPHVAMTGNFDISMGDASSVGSLIAEAKKGLQKDMELLSRSARGLPDDSKKNGVEPTEEDGADGESDNSDSEEKAAENDEDSDSDTDTEDKEEESAHYGLELAELTSEISIKQKLIDELERSQKRIQMMRQHYEDKLQLLQERIRATQEERDKVLATFTSTQSNQPTEKERKVRDEYERKLSDMQKEMKRLQSAKKEHARLLRNQTQHENQVKALKNDLAEMKRAKVKLLNKMKEEAAKHKDVELRRNREIAQLRKESRKRENTIRSLEAEKRVKEAVLKRKQEEVTALRRLQRGPLSNKAAGRVGPRHASKRLSVTPKEVKHRWQQLEKNINKIALSKQMVASMERDMERQLQQREELGRSLDQLMRRRDHALISRQDSSVIRDLEDQIESMKANIDYVQESIAESQQNIMQIEDSKENFDTMDVAGVVQGLTEVDSRYLVEKLYNMTINQSYSAAQKELAVKEMEAKLNELKQQNSTQQQLLEHLLNERTVEDIQQALSSGSSANSSRSNSPTETCNGNGNVRPTDLTTSHKIRRRTALPEELLYPIISSTALQDRLTITELPSGPSAQEEMADSNLMPPPLASGIVRVPSAPGSLKRKVTNAVLISIQISESGVICHCSRTLVASRPDQLKPSPVAARKVYDRQESTSPRLNRRTVNVAQGSLLGKPGSM